MSEDLYFLKKGDRYLLADASSYTFDILQAGVFDQAGADIVVSSVVKDF